MSKGSSAPSGQNTVVQSSQPPAAVLAAYQNLTNQAFNQAAQPQQQYTGPLVAGFTPQQQQGFETIQNLQGAYAPYLGAAGQAFQQATTPLWPSLPQFDVSGLPQTGISGIQTAQQYGAAAAQPIAQNIAPMVGLATGAAQAAPGTVAPYTGLAGSIAGGLPGQTAPYQGFGLGSAGQVQGVASSLPGQVSPYQGAALSTAAGAPGAIQSYLSPYTKNVTQALQGLYNQQNAQQLAQVRGSAVGAGAYGGDREAAAEALTAQQQQLAEAPTLAQTQQQGYLSAVQAAQQQATLEAQTALGAGGLGLQAGVGAGQLGLGAGQLGLGAGQLGVQAGLGAGQLGLGAGQLGLGALGTQGQLGLGAAQAMAGAYGTQGQLGLGAGQLNLAAGQGLLQEFNQQQQAQLGAEQANAWLASQAGYGLAGLGQEAQNLGLSGANALLGAGGLQQQLAQEQLNVPYEQWAAQQAYPYQQLNFLAPIVEGTGSLAGGTGSTSYPGPSLLGQAAGLGVTGLGAYGLLNQTGAFGPTGYLTGAGGLFGPSLGAAGVAGAALGDYTTAAAGLPSAAALLAAPFTGVKRGGRIGLQDGGGTGLGTSLPQVPKLSLDYIIPPGPAVKGEGPPKAPQPPPGAMEQVQPPNLMQDISALSALKKSGALGIGSPSGAQHGGGLRLPTASYGLGRGIMPHLGTPNFGSHGGIGLPRTSMTHLGVTPRFRLQAGGLGATPLASIDPVQGSSPNVQTQYQQYLQLPLENLQELSARVPPSSLYGQLIQRALMAKRMTPGSGSLLPPASVTPSSYLPLQIGQGAASGAPATAQPMQGGGEIGSFHPGFQDGGGDTSGGNVANLLEGNLLHQALAADQAGQGMKDGGETRNYVTEDEIDPHPIVDHSGDTIKIIYPSDGGKVLDLGLPTSFKRGRLQAGGTSTLGHVFTHSNPFMGIGSPHSGLGEIPPPSSGSPPPSPSAPPPSALPPGPSPSSVPPGGSIGLSGALSPSNPFAAITPAPALNVGSAKPTQPMTYNPISAPQLDPGMFTGYGAFGQANAGSITPGGGVGNWMVPLSQLSGSSAPAGTAAASSTAAAAVPSGPIPGASPNLPPGSTIPAAEQNISLGPSPTGGQNTVPLSSLTAVSPSGQLYNAGTGQPINTALGGYYDPSSGAYIPPVGGSRHGGRVGLQGGGDAELPPLDTAAFDRLRASGVPSDILHSLGALDAPALPQPTAASGVGGSNYVPQKPEVAAGGLDTPGVTREASELGASDQTIASSKGRLGSAGDPSAASQSEVGLGSLHTRIPPPPTDAQGHILLTPSGGYDYARMGVSPPARDQAAVAPRSTADGAADQSDAVIPSYLQPLARTIKGGESGNRNILYGPGNKPVPEGNVIPGAIGPTGRRTHAFSEWQFEPDTWNAANEAAKAWGRGPLDKDKEADRDWAGIYIARRDYRNRTGRELDDDAKVGQINIAALAPTWTSLGAAAPSGGGSHRGIGDPSVRVAQAGPAGFTDVGGGFGLGGGPEHSGLGTSNLNSEIDRVLAGIQSRGQAAVSDAYQSPWLPILATGLGMMASRSPYPLVAAGQGGLEGIRAFAQQQQQAPEIELHRAQARQAELETSLLPLRMRAIQDVTTGAEAPNLAPPIAGASTVPAAAEAASHTPDQVVGGDAPGIHTQTAATMSVGPAGMQYPPNFGAHGFEEYDGMYRSIQEQISAAQGQLNQANRLLPLDPNHLQQHLENISRIQGRISQLTESYIHTLNTDPRQQAETAGMVEKAREAERYRELRGPGAAIVGPGGGIIAQSPQPVDTIDNDPHSPTYGQTFRTWAYPAVAGTTPGRQAQQPAATEAQPIPADTGQPASAGIGPAAPGQGLPIRLGPQAEERAHVRTEEEEKRRQKVIDDGAAAQTMQATFGNMRRDANNIYTGPLAPQVQEAKSYLRLINPNAFNQDVASYEDFVKNSGALVRQTVREVSSRAAVQEYNLINQTLPNPTMSPQGLRRVMGELMGLNDYRIAKVQAQKQWEDNHNGAISGFETDWQSRVTPSAFIFARMDPAERQEVVAHLRQNKEGQGTLVKLTGELNYINSTGLDQALYD